MSRGHPPQVMEAMRAVKAFKAEYDEKGDPACRQELDDWREVVRGRIAMGDYIEDDSDSYEVWEEF